MRLRYGFPTCGVQELKLDPDAAHLSTLWAAVEEYSWCKKGRQDLPLLPCLTLLTSLKNNHQALARQLLDDEPDLDPHADSQTSDLCRRLWVASSELAPRLWRRRVHLSIDISSENLNIGLFC